MNCGPSAWDKRSREQMMSECDDCITQPCNPAEDGVCEALECCKHGVEDGACKECYNDTALLRQCLEALESAVTYRGVMVLSDPPQDAWKFHGVERKANAVIAALKERLK
jgi:hypothetical protein